MGLDDVADELYALPVQRFTEIRNTRAKELALSGDKSTAADVRRLRKPSQVAWLANTLSRRHPEEVETVLDLGRDLRRAQGQGDGADIRRLSVSRQNLMTRVLRITSEEANAAGMSFGTDVQKELVATFEAAMANESSGAALKAGRLTDALRHVGFGSDSDGSSVRRGQVSKSRRSTSQSDSRRDVDREKEGALAEAQSQFDTASVALVQAQEHNASAKARRREASEELRRVEQDVLRSSRELEKAVAQHERKAEALRGAARHSSSRQT